MSTTATPFVFNKDFDDLDQVAHLWPTYTARYRELTEAGQYPYDDLFKGHFGALVADGKNEDAAIYLLQVTRHVREYEARVRALREGGYTEPEQATKARNAKYASVAMVGREYHSGRYGDIRILEGARLVYQDGHVIAVLPKGKRTRGHRVRTGYVLVKP